MKQFVLGYHGSSARILSVFELGSLAVAARGEAVRPTSAAGQRERERGHSEPPQDGLSVTVPFHTSVSSQS